MPARSYLVIGADGLIGGALTRELRSQGTTVHTTAKDAKRESDITLDLADAAIERVALPRADVAVVCASFNGFAECRRDPVKARQVNALAPEILTRRLRQDGTRVIYLSSSAVFDFQVPQIAASAPTCPRTVYGAVKAEGEQRVLMQGQGTTVLRLAKVLSANMPLLKNWRHSLGEGKIVRAFSDLKFSPVSLDLAVEAVLAIANADEDGIYQVSGASDVSYADAARHIAKRLGVPESRVQEDSALRHGIPAEEIATFTSMDMSRYTALTNRTPPKPLDVLDTVCGLKVPRAEPCHVT
jgi:dTDP-4-dehydrorhamnose reductase